MGLAQIGNGDFPGANQTLSLILQIDATRWKTINALGDAVLHDPPRFGIAGELYSGEFCQQLARVLKRRGKLDEARAETQAGLALNPNFSVHGFRVGAESNNPIFLTQRERLLEGLRKAGVPEE